MKRNFRKLIALVTLVLLVVTVAAGCGNGKVNDNTPAASAANTSVAASAAKTSVTLWHTWAEGPGLDATKKIVENFNSKSSKVEVKMEYVASRQSGNTTAMDKLMAAVAAGSPPEIALLDGFTVPQWASKNSLVDLTEMVKKHGINKEDFYNWAIDGVSYKGKIYGIPYNADLRALFYNKDAFKAAVLDPSKPPKTIKELEEMSKKLTVKENGKYKTIGFIPWLYAGRPIYTWGWTFGGKFYDLATNKLSVNDPKNIEALQWEVDYAKSYGQKEIVQFASGLGANDQDPFLTGQVAMAVKGNWDIANIKKYKPEMNFGIAPIPTPTGSDNITWAGGWAFVLPKNSKNNDASMEFLKYTASDEAQTLRASTEKSFSPVKSVNMKVYGNDPLQKVFVDLLDKTMIRPPIAVGQMLWDELDKAGESARNGLAEPKKLLDDVQAKISAELEKIK